MLRSQVPKYILVIRHVLVSSVTFPESVLGTLRKSVSPVVGLKRSYVMYCLTQTGVPYRGHTPALTTLLS